LKKQVSVSFIAVAVLIAVLAAGCTSQTASPTPSTSAAQSTGTASTAQMASYVQTLGYNVTSPFKKLDLPVTYSFGERDQYGGTATAGNKTYVVSAIVLKSSTETSDVFNSLISGRKAAGYTAVATNSTSTTLENSYGVRVVVSQDTGDNLVVMMTG
jgi:hypothetical protein